MHYWICLSISHPISISPKARESMKSNKKKQSLNLEHCSKNLTKILFSNFITNQAIVQCSDFPIKITLKITYKKYSIQYKILFPFEIFLEGGVREFCWGSSCIQYPNKFSIKIQKQESYVMLVKKFPQYAFICNKIKYILFS
jgi:hypothetical protein